MCVWGLYTKGMKKVSVCFFLRKKRYIYLLCKLNALAMQYYEIDTNKIHKGKIRSKLLC